jgi:hypothetical protein
VRRAPGQAGSRPLARWRHAAALALALLAGSSASAAPREASLEAGVAAAQDRLVATLDLGPAFPDEALRRLGNGLTNVVAVVVAVVPAEGGPPVAITGHIVDVLYDVWDEDFTVTVRDTRLPRPVRRTAADAAALRRLLSDARALDLGPLAQLPPGRFRLEVRVEVNPVSRELMDRTRELLANPALSGRPGAGSRSVLGAMAGYLLREPGPGDDVVFLHSRPFERAEVGLP